MSNCNNGLKIKIPIYINGVFLEDTHTLLSIGGIITNTSSKRSQDVVTINMPISEISTQLSCLYMQGDVQIQRTTECGKIANTQTISIYSFKLNEIITALSNIKDITRVNNINEICLREFIKFDCILYREKYFKYFNQIIFDINSGFQVLSKYIIECKDVDVTKLTQSIYDDIKTTLSKNCVMYYSKNCGIKFKMQIDENSILTSCPQIEGIPITVIGKGVKKCTGNESMLKNKYDELKYYLKKKCYSKCNEEYIEIIPLAILI